MSKEKVIFICHGNICRSPMAQFIFLKEISKRGLLNDYEVSSMAVSYEEEGNDIDIRAKNELRKNDIPFSFHPSHRITLKDFKEADHIYAMDHSNINILKKLFPYENHSKVELLNAPYDIDDPWYSNDFNLAFSQIKESIVRLLGERYERKR